MIDTTTNKVTKTIDLGLPIGVPGALVGAGPNSIAVDAVNNIAYVALYNANAIAVVDLSSFALSGLIPVGYAPSSVVLDTTDGNLLVANDKGIGTTGFGVAPPPTIRPKIRTEKNSACTTSTPTRTLAPSASFPCRTA